MIDVLTDFPEGVFACRVSGAIRRDDYDRIIIPAVENAFARHSKLRVYIEAGNDISAEAGAMWDDFKLGVRHWTSWERIAIVTGLDWIGPMVRVMSALLPGEVRLFKPEEAGAARAWVSEGL